MRQGCHANDWKTVPLVGEIKEIFTSPEPGRVHVSSPALAALASGKLVAACDQAGPTVKDVPGRKGKLEPSGHHVQGRIFVSRDKGTTWEARDTFPFWQAALFRDGFSMYLLGNCGQVMISKSADGGETWTAPEDLTPRGEAERWYIHAPGNVWTGNEQVVAVQMQVADPSCRGELSSVLAPVVLRAKSGTTLTSRKSWTVSPPAQPFRDLTPGGPFDWLGVPVYDVPRADRGVDLGHGRWANRIGWRQAHVLRIEDPNHVWHDPTGRTFHLIFRADTHRSNLALVLKAVEDEAGGMALSFLTTPAGSRLLFLPMPGGNMGFDLLYDEETRLYWLLGSQVRDSMVRPDRLDRRRTGLPGEERSRLQLSFSRNLVDWCFAGYVAGAAEGQTLQDPRMALHGGDLYFVCGCGAPHPRLMVGGSALGFGAVPGFRSLVY